MMGSFLGFKHLKLAHKYYKTEILRTLSNDFTIQEHFLEIDRLRSRYLCQKMAEDSFKNFVCSELIEECDIDTSSFYLQGFERHYVITMDFAKLKKHGLIKLGSNQMSIVNSFLGYLEPFPFDRKYLNESYEKQTIKFLRDSVEKQYLAWKYKVELQQINEIMFRFQSSLFIGRSLRSLKRNSMILDMIPTFKNSSLSKKIYLINQHPFSIQLVLNFNKALQYLNWDSFAASGNKSFQRSFNHIYFLIKVLQNKKFSNKQIRESIPFLNISFGTFINRMNVILSHPALVRHQKHDQFLHLLCYPTIYFMNLEGFHFESFEELKDAFSMIHTKMKLRKGSERITITTIKYQISNYFAIDEEHLEMIKRHPKYSVITEQQLGSTLRFLQKKKFLRTEVLESIIIILYPSHLIEKALKKIEEESEALQNVGFLCGCVPEQTNFFKCGTKSKRKTLQLCLYYMEKQFNFSWDGVLNLCIKNFDEEEEH